MRKHRAFVPLSTAVSGRLQRSFPVLVTFLAPAQYHRTPTLSPRPTPSPPPPIYLYLASPSHTTVPAPRPSAALYDALGSSLTGERAVLLLYALLHSCPRFHEYCLVGWGGVCVCVGVGAGRGAGGARARAALEVLMCSCVQLFWGLGHRPRAALRLAPGRERRAPCSGCVWRCSAWSLPRLPLSTAHTAPYPPPPRCVPTWTPCCCRCWSCSTRRRSARPTRWEQGCARVVGEGRTSSHTSPHAAARCLLRRPGMWKRACLTHQAHRWSCLWLC
jgi:hypothetical protein